MHKSCAEMLVEMTDLTALFFDVASASTEPDQAQYAEINGRVMNSIFSGNANTAPDSGNWKPTR